MKLAANNRYVARFVIPDLERAFQAGEINGFQYGTKKRTCELMMEESDELEAKWQDAEECIHTRIVPTDCFTLW